MDRCMETLIKGRFCCGMSPHSIAAFSLGLIVALAGGAAWLRSQPSRQPDAVEATFADAPSLEYVEPGSRTCVPTLSAICRPVAQITYARTATNGPTPAFQSASVPDEAPGLSAPASITAGEPLVAAAPVKRLPPTLDADSQPSAARAAAPAAPPELLRSDAMEMIARQADESIRQGMDLADRGACFVARSNFIAAMRLLAQGLDNDDASSHHSQALSAALTAMKEAQDFLPAPARSRANSIFRRSSSHTPLRC